MGDRDRSDRGRERERSDSRGKNNSSANGRPRADSRDRGGGGGERQGSTTSLLVRNLSYKVRAEDIRNLMVKYGEVRDVYIPQVIVLLFGL